ncbi:MAG: HD domain-containing phosphohydrolase [Gallionella sp.]
MPFELIENHLGDSAIPLVVVIDDEFTSRVILERVANSIQKNITVKAFGEPTTAMAWIRENQPDLILIDYMMADMTGLEAVKQMREITLLEGVPIVMVTSTEDRDIRYQALDAGASDFITKPIDPFECRIRCRNLLYLRLQQKVILRHTLSLEQQISNATRQIHAREQETLLRLAKAGEFRDTDTGNHVLRMAKYSYLIGQALGMSEEHCKLIELAAPMHDIGKIGIPDHILLKPSSLSANEWAVMKTHPTIGHQILHGSPSKYLSLGAEIALAHHEKFDGSGYPNGTKGESIPIAARIVAVADVFDALTSERPYKKKWTNEAALEYLTTNSGSHFDPLCVQAFMAQLNRVETIQLKLSDTEPNATA